MTVPSEVNRSGPYGGNGVTTVFDYEFRILDASHIRVVRLNTDGTETVLTLDADYSVSGVGADNGYITTVAAPVVGQAITLLRNIPFTQETDLENQGAYYAETVEDALDAAAMRDQQLQEQINRSIKIPVSADPAELDELIEDVLLIASSANNIDIVADNIDAVKDVAPYAQTIAENVTDINNFADVYQGAHADNPATRNDGTALQAGDLYFNTAVKIMRVYNDDGWKDAAAQSLDIAVKSFVGNGVATTFPLDVAPGTVNNILVEVGGVLQVPLVDFSVVGTTLTILPAVANGVEINTWNIATVSTLNVPADLSVTTAKIVDLAVTLAKLADGILSANAAGRAKMADGFVTLAKMEAGAVPDFVRGLTLVNNAGNPNTHIDITAGSAKLGTLLVVNGSTLTKRLNANWAAGNANGGLDTGSSSPGATYHIYSLRRQSDGAFDAVFSLSASGPNMALLAGYDVVRRIGPVVLDGSGNIRPFIQTGLGARRKYLWSSGAISDVNAINPGTSAVNRTLTVPTGIQVDAIIGVLGGVTATSVVASQPGGILVTPLSLPDSAPSASNFSVLVSIQTSGDSQNLTVGSTIECQTNTSGQVRSRVERSAATTNIRLNTLGFIDEIGV